MKEARPVLLWTITLALLLLVAGYVIFESLRSREARRERPNIVLVSLDTLRPDFLGAYGYSRETTPHIDALAKRGVVFDSAVSQSAWTLPAHFSLLTGLYPDRPMLRYAEEHVCRITQRVVSVAETAASHGYATAAFTGGGYMSADRGFGQGFEVFESHGRRLEDNLESVLAWLNRNAVGPFFLFVHSFNAHRPYSAPEDVVRRFVDSVPEDCVGVTFSNEDFSGDRIAPRCLGLEVTEFAGPGEVRNLEFLRGLYAAEVAYLDDLVGRVIEELGRLGVLERTIIVVTSDHGEELFEHRDLDHVKTLYQEVIRVPLVIAGPGAPAGRRRSEVVELVDVAPTLIEMAGFEHGPSMDGRSLLSTLSRQEEAEELGYSATWYDARRRAFERHPFEFKAAAVGNRWKLIVKRKGSVEELELYDLSTDPGETLNLAAEHPARAEHLRSKVRAWLSQHGDRAYCEEAEFGEETKEQLRALGYID